MQIVLRQSVLQVGTRDRCAIVVIVVSIAFACLFLTDPAYWVD